MAPNQIDSAEESGAGRGTKVYHRLMSVFRKKNPDGSYLYPQSDVEHWIPYIVVVAEVPSKSWSTDTAVLMERFFIKAEISFDEKDSEAMLKQFIAYYEKHPINPALAADIKEALFELAIDPSVLGASKEAAISKMLGVSRKIFETRQAPQGDQVASGPMARFNLGIAK